MATTARQQLPAEPPHDCALCPRLASFREENDAAHPDWFNAPVPGFGDEAAWLLIMGLAPGLKGANRTSRPFTGDFAGDLLYPTLLSCGLAEGTYAAHPDDGLTLRGAFISNAVRCVPPQNKPIGSEINNCRPFLIGQLNALPQLTHIVALGRIAHESLIRALGGKLKDTPFRHGAHHKIGGYILADSYHCSRYNTNTGRLTADMFAAVFQAVIADRNATA
ncbi:MAG: uracil-DNA glycosylase [Pseudomonadota bacterium]